MEFLTTTGNIGIYYDVISLNVTLNM